MSTFCSTIHSGVSKWHRVFLFGGLMVLFLTNACQYFETEEADLGVPVAAVGDAVLYESDLKDLFLGKMHERDSILLRENFINSWVREQLVFQDALKNLPEPAKDKDKELETYYRSLIRYEYEQEFIRNRLNQKVDAAEVDTYYVKNSSVLTLRESIYKITVVVFDQDFEDLDKVKKLHLSDSESSIDELYEYCIQSAEKFNLDLKKWLTYNDIRSQLFSFPLDEDMLYQRDFIELQSGNLHLMIRVHERKQKGELAPIEYKEQSIKSVIINKRKLNLLKEMEQQIFENAKKNHKFEVYD